MTRRSRWSPYWRQTKCYGTIRRLITGEHISKTLLDGLRLLLHRAQENLERIGKDAEGIVYDPPGSGKPVVQDARWSRHTPEAVGQRHRCRRKNREHPGCRWEEVLGHGSLDYHLQRIPSALMHCRLERLMLIIYRRCVPR